MAIFSYVCVFLSPPSPAPFSNLRARAAIAVILPPKRAELAVAVDVSVRHGRIHVEVFGRRRVAAHSAGVVELAAEDRGLLGDFRRRTPGTG
jgi:hypothetical protein